MESRKELAVAKNREPIDTRYQGPAQIGPYRRWLQRCLVEAADRGDQAEVDRITEEMRQRGMADD